MNLSEHNLRELHDAACLAAQAAGQIIQSAVNTDLTVEKKSGAVSLAAQVVTEIDLQCDALIRRELQPSVDRFDLALLTEETPDDGQRLQKDFFWCVDPLDGTLAFTRGTPGYSVAISLISKAGVPVIGVVFDPVERVLYSAIKGLGAWQDQQPWPDIPRSDGSELTVHLDCSFIESDAFHNTWSRLSIWAEQAGFDSVQRRSDAGGVMSAISVLQEAPACYFKPPKDQSGGGSLWDFAATACIYHELGMPANTYLGDAFQFNPRGSTFMNHCGVMYATNQKIAELSAALSYPQP